MAIQSRFETYVHKMVGLLEGDPLLSERSKKLPKIEVNLEQDLDFSVGPTLGVRIEDHNILLPRVPEELLDPVLVKIATDWLFLPYLKNLPEPAHQFSFLTPWFFLKKSGEGMQEWERLWKDVFPTPILHRGYPEFSYEYLLRTYEVDDIFLFYDVHTCFKALAEKCARQRLDTIPLEMFLDHFFEQILSLREPNETDKRIIALAIELGSTDAQLLQEELNLPRSTAYHNVSRCLRKLHLEEVVYLKGYRLDLEPILLFFLGAGQEDANRIVQHFRVTPYLRNFGRFITPENERTSRDELTLLLHLWFPGQFTYKLRAWMKTFTEDRRRYEFHWFRYDRFEHGYNLRSVGIDVQIHRTFNLRGGMVAERVDLLPGDLEVVGHRLSGSRPASFQKIAQLTGMKVSSLFAAEKRLFPEIIAGKDIFLELNHFLPVREFRFLLKNPDLHEVQYFKTFPEYYFYRDVNERELLVLLMVPQEQVRELETFVADRANRVIFSGFNLGIMYSHLANLADLEPEYNYDQQGWKDPFRVPKRWQWLF